MTKPLGRCLWLLPALVCIVAGCGYVPFTRIGAGAVEFSFSFVGESGTTSRHLSRLPTAKAYRLDPLPDERYYKEHLSADRRGTLVAAFTPRDFILDLREVNLYRREQTGIVSEMLREGIRDNPVPQHVNLVYARRFLRNIAVTPQYWDGFSLFFMPWAASDGQSDFYLMSLVGVDLGPVYEAVRLAGEPGPDVAGWSEATLALVERLRQANPGLHYFLFDDLQPFASYNLTFLIIGADVPHAGIQNPFCEEGVWEIPGPPEFRTVGNATQVFYPGVPFDLSNYAAPEAVLYWNMEGLVEVYDNGTPEREDDIATFSLDNPFPVQLVIQEWTPPAPNGDGDVVPPSEVFMPAASAQPGAIALQWINPIDQDFDRVVVVRKLGSAPATHEDGELVHDGSRPNYFDTTAPSGAHCYYLVYTVDYSGNKSVGVRLDYVQP